MSRKIIEITGKMEFADQLKILRPICISSSSMEGLIELIQDRLSQIVGHLDNLTSEQLTTILSLISLKDFFNQDLKATLEKKYLTQLAKPVNVNDTSEFINQLVMLEEGLLCFRGNPEVVVKIAENLSQVVNIYVSFMLTQQRSSNIMGVFYKSFERIAVYYQSSKIDPALKEKIQASSAKLESLKEGNINRIQGLREIYNKNFIYTNLQNKTKEVLNHLGVKYLEEEFVGPYLVDFYLPDLKTIIEVTGPVHYIAKSDELNMRTKFKIEVMQNSGHKVVTIRNQDLQPNMDDKVKVLRSKLGI